MKNILVVYLITKFCKKSNFINFIKFYKKYKSGRKHKLIICYKLLDKKKINFFRQKLKNIKCEEFVDEETKNDFDFGSYYRVAKKYKKYLIFFMNSHSYPIKKLWLKKIISRYKSKMIIGTSGSYESMLTSLKIKKFYKIYKYIKDYLFFKKNFNYYPNFHIRTANFLIQSKDLLFFCKNKAYKSKKDAWISESGINGLTNYFSKKGYKVAVVNSDSKIFNSKNVKQSKTYFYKNQEKLLIADKHTNKYFNLSKKEKAIYESEVWR